jgi:hypothetical protein
MEKWSDDFGVEICWRAATCRVKKYWAITVREKLGWFVAVR